MLLGKFFKDLTRLFENILDTLFEEIKDKSGIHDIIIELTIFILKKEIYSVEMNIGISYSYEYVSIGLGVLSKVNIVSQNKKTFDSLQYCIDKKY